MHQDFVVKVEFKGIKNVKDNAFQNIGSMMVRRIAIMVQMKMPMNEE